MNNSNLIHQSMTVSSSSLADFEPARRLIVLVPELDADTAVVAGRIRELAKALQGHVQLIGLSKDAAHEPGLRRQLVTLRAMVGDEHVSVESKSELGSNWLNVVRSEWQKGDVIACFAGHSSGLMGRPWKEILESDLNTTVYVLDGMKQSLKWVRSTWISAATAWAGSIGIILGFFWLQSKLTQFPQNWAYSTLLYLSILVETGLIWVWNSLFN